MQIYRNERLGKKTKQKNAGKWKGENGIGRGIKKLYVSTLALTPAKESRGCSN